MKVEIEWRPIETAPEGRHVLIGAKNWRPASEVFTLPVLIAYKRDGIWGTSGQEWSHWAEIPEPPK